jgi:hypothetical protein
MNNKIKAEKYRNLPIASLVTGILSFGYFITFSGNIDTFISSYIENFISGIFLITIFVLSFFVIFLSIPAIICGSIDLKRIEAGRYSNRGKNFDITGIVLGSVSILFASFIALFVFAFSEG